MSDIESEVCKDILERQKLGISKYGETVGESNLNLVQWLRHAYEESLDHAIYLKKAIEILDVEKRLSSLKLRRAQFHDLLIATENGDPLSVSQSKQVLDRIIAIEVQISELEPDFESTISTIKSSIERMKKQNE